MTRRMPLKSVLAPYVSLPVFMWLALWAAINTGPWNLSGFSSGGMGAINALRAIAPVIVLIAGGLILLINRKERIVRLTLPEIFFWLYGLAMLGAAYQVEPWFNTAYWAFSFLAVLVVVRLFVIHGDKPLEQLLRLNILSWITASAVLVLLLFTAREILFEAETGYGIVHRVGEVASGAMSRSTGMARFAAIPAVLAFVMFWRIHSLRSWVIAVTVFAASVSLVWFMQSRGALFSLAGTLVFIMLFMGKLPRIIAVVLFVLALGGGIDLIPEETQQYVVEHSTRGTGAEGFKSMSGRDRIWSNAWEAIKEQPLLGYGPQADRRIILENAQSGSLYAWLSGGILGVIGYVGGVLVVWWIFFRIYLGNHDIPQRHWRMLMMSAGILAFFTLRSYPENTAALFSVDLLVQLPAMVYIAMLHRYLQVARRNKRRREKILCGPG
ncbi:O-antigen ligase family protein [Thiolapillus sp.]